MAITRTTHLRARKESRQMTSSLTQVRGTVRAFHRVTRNRVQIEFKEHEGIFELFIDQSWVIFENDTVTAAGYKDETGKYVCLAYRNHSKEVTGWTEGGGLPGLLYVRWHKGHAELSEYFIWCARVLFLVCSALILLEGGMGSALVLPFLAIPYFFVTYQLRQSIRKDNAATQDARRDLDAQEKWCAVCAEARKMVSTSG